MESEAPSIQPTRRRIIKPHEKLIWIGNSTAILFGVFWLICVIQDFLVWVVGKLLGMPIKLSFDFIDVPTNISYDTSQVVIITGIIPVYFLLVGVVAGILHARYRLKKDLRKLFFLWAQYISFSIFGGSFVTAFASEQSNMRTLWQYLGLNMDFMPMIAFAVATLLIFYGIFNLWRFLNISPSSQVNKVPSQRINFILCVQVIPLLIFYLLGFILYPNPDISSRFFSSLMVWVPILAGLIASIAKDSGFAKVPAFKDSELKVFQPLYWGFAFLVYTVILFIS